MTQDSAQIADGSNAKPIASTCADFSDYEHTRLIPLPSEEGTIQTASKTFTLLEHGLDCHTHARQRTEVSA